jgi:hypothetical protein
MDKIMLSLASFADELEREKARQRTYDAMLRKAREGHVTGGVVFGYDNVQVLAPSGKKSHVARIINDTQAAIVREIFDRYASGWGYASIAKALNAVHAPSPRATENKPAGWSPSSVRCILLRDLYRGVVTWNRSQKRDKWGRQRQKARPETEWMVREAPELRIISDALWAAAQDRMTRTRAILSTTQGPRAIVRRNIGSRYLLSGFARCAECGWSMTVITRRHGKTRKPFLGCLSHYKRGPHICPNGRLVPMEKADHAVLGSLESDALDPRIISTIIDMVFAQLTPESADRNAAALQRDLRVLDGKIANLTKAVESGAAIDSLIAQLRDRQQERERLIATIAAARAVDQIYMDRGAIEARVQAQVANWRALLTESIEDGRTLLREVLSGPLVLTPNAEGYHFRAGVATGELIAGVIAAGAQEVASPAGGAEMGAGAHKVASPRGDAEVGARAHKLASPTGTSNMFRPLRVRLRRAA